MNEVRLYQECIDTLNTLICIVKTTDAIKRITDSKGELSTTLNGGGTVWEKNVTLRYNNVEPSKIGNLKDWKGRFNNGIYSISKKGTDVSYSIPISELHRINREEKISKHLEQIQRKQISPYSQYGTTGNVDFSSIDKSLAQPQQSLYESVRNLAGLITSIAGVIGAMSTMGNSVFVRAGKDAYEKMVSSKKSIESASEDLKKAREVMRRIRK